MDDFEKGRMAEVVKMMLLILSILGAVALVLYFFGDYVLKVHFF